MWMKCGTALVLSILLVATVRGQGPGMPGAAPPGAAAGAPLSGAGGAPVGPAAAPAPGGCLGNIMAACAACKQAFCASPIGQFVNNGMAPVRAFSGGLIGGCCPVDPNMAANLAKPADSADGAAARIKADEAAAAERRANVRYLGTVDCRYWPEAKAALINALRADRNECVRLEAAIALGRGCCCNQATVRALELTVSGSDEDGFPPEASCRVQMAAMMALDHCLSLVPMEPPVGPIEIIEPERKEKEREKELDKEKDKEPLKLLPAPTAGSEPAAAAKTAVGALPYYQRVERLPLAKVVASARRTLEKATSSSATTSARPTAGSLSQIMAGAMASPGAAKVNVPLSATAQGAGNPPPAQNKLSPAIYEPPTVTEPVGTATLGPPTIAPIPQNANPEYVNTPHANTPYVNSPYVNTPYVNSPYVNTPYANTPYVNSPYVNSPPPVSSVVNRQSSDLSPYHPIGVPRTAPAAQETPNP
jgi:hypothetical protein